MLSQSGRVRRDSDEDKAFIALSISMTTRIDREIVEADLAMSLEKISQPICGNCEEQRWKCDCAEVSKAKSRR